MADRSGTHKRFLVVFALLGQAMTAALIWIPQGEWLSAAVVYALATLGFMGGNIFYDALLVEVSPSERYDLVSALGFGLGYLGGGLLFTLCILMSLFPSSFGFDDSIIAVRLSFLLVAVWWLVFSLPIFLWVRGPKREGKADTIIHTILNGFRQVKNTVTHIRQRRTVALFLVAYWLYIDGVDTIVRMAVDYGRALGFSRDDLILALLITQFVGFPAAILFGYLGERMGTKRAIYAAIGIYILVTVWGGMMRQTWEFFGIAIAIGLVQGGIQSLSRAYYARLIPAEKAAEFFGFYNMLGKFAAVLGPVMVGSIGVLTGSPRMGILSVLILFVTGGIVLFFVENGASAAEKP
jgi:UMF1 family MFS transporter